MTKLQQIDADKIVTSVDKFRRELFPSWDLERKIEAYANGGPPPSDDDTCEDDIVPLGYAQAFMSKEMGVLLDPLLMEPGVFHCFLNQPAVKLPTRTMQVQTQFNAALNAAVMSRVMPILQNAAGRSTVTGRAYLFRKSPNECFPKSGRLIHPKDAGIDVLDGEFREWAFAEKISLRDIEERLKVSSGGKYGWQKEGLEKLKLWIMASEAEKYGERSRDEWMSNYDPDAWLAVDASTNCYAEPVDVYWYFRKNGKLTKNDPRYGGHEEVDLYCVSRFGGEMAVEEKIEDNMRLKSLRVGGYDNETALDRFEAKRRGRTGEQKESYDKNERLIFFMPSLFRSVEECLILHVDDAAISGDQKLREVRGTGKTAMPKLAVMEGLLTDLIGGLSFANQVTWAVKPGVGQEYMDQLQRGGLRSGQAFPEGIRPMEKNNSMTGMNAAMGAIRMLDNSVSADSTANATGTFGGTQQEFAAQAQAELAGKQITSSRRSLNWLLTLDKYIEMVANTLCRHWPEQKREFPCYQDAARLRMVLKMEYGIHEDEWDAARWKFKARRLAGSLTRQQSIAVNTGLMQTVGPVMPSILPFLAKEILRATLGDVVAEQLTTPQEEQEQSQQKNAMFAVTAAFVTGQPLPPQPMDDPMIHSKVASEVAQGHIKAATSAGIVSPSEVVGVMAVLAYAAAHVQRLPEQLAKPGMEQIQKMGQEIQAVPVQQPQPDGAMTEKEKMDAQIKMANQQRLQQDGANKWKHKEIDDMMKMRSLSNTERAMEAQQKTLATQRAKTYLDMETSLNDADNAAFAPANL